ncbi:MAG: hypothetical protein WCV85_05415 [Patescibacteria group bacterium]|jgi:hypothetical protein
MRYAVLWIDSHDNNAAALQAAAEACPSPRVVIRDISNFHGTDASSPRLFTPDGGERTEIASIFAYLRTGDELATP